MTDRPVAKTPFRHDSDLMLAKDPQGVWSDLRERMGAIESDQAHQPLWYLLRYRDINDVFRDAETFSSRAITPNLRQEGIPSGMGPGDEFGFKLLPGQMDPPEHGKYRRIMNPLLNPTRVDALTPSIRAHFVSLLDAVRDHREFDFVTEIAHRYPTAVFLRLVGCPAEDSTMLLRWVQDMFGAVGSAGDAEVAMAAMAAAGSLLGYINDVIESRRRNPLDEDLITDLLLAEVDGRPIEPEILGQIVFQLYAGGLDTVAGLLSYTMWHFATFSQDRARIVEDPSLVRVAVEECLRYYGIVNTARVVNTETTVGGCPMSPGDRVVLPVAAANRDPQEFPDAERFDLARTPNRHLAFGSGPHRCVGSHLARRELTVAVQEWHARIPHYRVADGADIHHHLGPVHGLSSLPLIIGESGPPSLHSGVGGSDSGPR